MRGSRERSINKFENQELDGRNKRSEDQEMRESGAD